MSGWMKAQWDAARQRQRDHVGREVKAYKTSGPWFLACFACIVMGVLVAMLGAGVVAGALVIAGVALLYVGNHKHGKAGGHDQPEFYGGGV